MGSDSVTPTTPVTTVLWDIDGTLLHSGGVAAHAFLDAVAEVTGTRPTPERRDYGGRLDTEIADMLLTAVGAATTLVADVLEVLARLVDERLGELRAQTITYPGVEALVGKLAQAGVRQTVVTGNLAAIARHKLEAGRPDPADRARVRRIRGQRANSRRRGPGGTRPPVGSRVAAGPRRGVDSRRHAARPRLRARHRRTVRAGGNRTKARRGTGRPRCGHRAARPLRPAASARPLADLAFDLAGQAACRMVAVGE